MLRAAMWPALLAVLLFASALGGDFVYDDGYLLLANTRLVTATAHFAFTSDLWGAAPWAWNSQHYRPLAMLYFSGLYRVFGLNPFAFHAADILLNAAAVFAFYCLLSALGYSNTVRMIAALLFAVHPLHVEAVSWMTSGATETLAGALTLASLACFAHGRRAVSWIFAVLAMFTKESGLAIPALIAVLAYLNCPDRRRFRTAWSAAYPYLLVAAAYIGARYAFLARPPRGALIAALTSHWTAIPAAIAHYLLALFWPWPLAVHYELPGRATVLVAFAILAAWVYAAMRFESLQEDLMLCGALIACPLALPVLTSPAMPPWLQVQDRYAYVATTGACLLVAILLDRLSSQRLKIGVCMALVLAGSAASIRQQRVWHDNETLFAHALAVTPTSKIASIYLGAVLYKAARYDEAEAVYRAALRYRPDDREILNPLIFMRKQHP